MQLSLELSFKGRAGRVRGRGEDRRPSTPGDEELRDLGGEERLPEQHGGTQSTPRRERWAQKSGRHVDTRTAAQVLWKSGAPRTVI